MPAYLVDNSIFLRVKSERHSRHFSSSSFEGKKNVREKKDGEFDFVNLRSRVLVSTLQLSGVKQKQDKYVSSVLISHMLSNLSLEAVLSCCRRVTNQNKKS